MILVKIFSGLGNQMFQYAFARSLSLKRGVPVKLDATALPDKFGRRYHLDSFNINAAMANQGEITRLSEPRFGLLRRIIAKIVRQARPRPKSYRKELKDYVYDSNMLVVDGDSYFDGYWQNQRYFIDISEVIRSDFTFRNPPEGRNAAALLEIERSNSVSIHIRRGDYLNSPPSALIHGVCTLEYYREAINVILSKVINPVFYIFSDDPEWVKKEFIVDQVSVVVENNTDKPQEDLRLMSFCKHNIIANSTFSWWAAWLNSNPDKIVIAPKQWVVLPGINADDIIPEGWIKL